MAEDCAGVSNSLPQSHTSPLFSDDLGPVSLPPSPPHPHAQVHPHELVAHTHEPDALSTGRAGFDAFDEHEHADYPPQHMRDLEEENARLRSILRSVFARVPCVSKRPCIHYFVVIDARRVRFSESRSSP
jgi:hypothetical protein